jgi:hypothetical protein
MNLHIYSSLQSYYSRQLVIHCPLCHRVSPNCSSHATLCPVIHSAHNLFARMHLPCILVYRYSPHFRSHCPSSDHTYHLTDSASLADRINNSEYFDFLSECSCFFSLCLNIVTPPPFRTCRRPDVIHQLVVCFICSPSLHSFVFLVVIRISLFDSVNLFVCEMLYFRYLHSAGTAYAPITSSRFCLALLFLYYSRIEISNF